MKRIYLFLLLICCASLVEAQKIKVACVGNSVTFGYGLANPAEEAYPAQLQKLLGEGYEVGNFGKSGATLLSKGHRPYVLQKEFEDAKAFAADLVVIHLGLNDTDPRNWPNYKDEFVNDYLQLIDAFRKVNPACKIWICRLTPITAKHPRFESGTRDWYWQIQHQIEEIAGVAGVSIIDLQEGLYARPDLLPDALHPTVEGASIIARTVYSSLTGNFGGLKMSSLFTDGMVLQCNESLRITGTSNAGDQITVSVGGQKKRTVTSSNGKWSVVLDPLKAGGPYELSVSGANKRYVYKDVLAGEVWLCSGQSNMAFMVAEAAEKAALLKKAGDSSNVRLFDMKPRWMTNSVEWDGSVLDSLNSLQYFKDARWEKCNDKNVSRFSAIAYAFGQMLSDSLNVPVGLILNAVGGSPCESWIDRRTLEFNYPGILNNWTKNDRIQNWVRERASLNIKKSDNSQQRHPYEPCYLFESGIIPLASYPVKGVIWYQGESNAHNKEIHEILFPLLVDSWRKNWNKEFPFYYVQLSGLNRPSWPHFRDSQRRLEKIIPGSGMAVSSDLGDSLDVHPKRKQEVGERLARLALNKTYGKDIVPSGPQYKESEFKNGYALISFDYANGLRASDDKDLRSFEIAEFDGLYFPAKAIVEGDKIKVWNDKVKHPRFVRYGWAPYTNGNLVNRELLPASTFTSSDN